MAIHVDVFTRLNERRVRQDARALVDEFDSAGERAGKNFGENLSAGIERSGPRVERSAARMEKATDKVADSMGRVNVEMAKYAELQKKSTATDRQKIQQSEALARAQRAHAAAVRDATRAMMRSNEESDRTVSRMATLNTSLSLMGKGSGALAIGALAPTLAVAAGAAATAAGAIALLPGAIGGAVAAFGALKIATLGFGDAMSNLRDPEKFAESLQSLSPNAQQAALSIRSLMPAFDSLKNTTQDALFDGISGQIQSLSTSLMPTVQRVTVGVAGAFNEIFMGVTSQLMSPDTFASLDNLADNVVSAFDKLAPAAAPFTAAMTDIMSVGSEFLPGMADAVSAAAQKFAAFISEGMRTGELKQHMADALAVAKEIGRAIIAVGNAFVSLGPAAREVLPVLVDGLDSVSKLLREHPNLIWGVVGAFTAWKTIQGVAALTSSLQTISTLLSTGLPAAAGKGAGGITAALAKIKMPPWLLTIGKWAPLAGVGLNSDVRTPGEVGLPAVQYDDQGRPYLPGTAYDPGLNRTGGSFGPGADQFQPHPGRAPFGTGLTNGRPHNAPETPLFDVPVPTGTNSGPRLPDAPVLPYTANRSTAPTAALFSAENAVYDARHDLEEKRARLTQLQSTNTATDSDIQDARNDVAKAEEDEHEAQLRLNEARLSATRAGINQLNSAANQLGDIGAKLDQDFGLSRGLPGLAENLIKFVANLAAAGPMAQLGAIAAASPSQGGYGAMGVLGAQGAFGDRFTGIDPQRMYGGYGPSGIGPAALGGGMGYGAYPGDAALLANVPSGRYTQEERGDLTQGLADCSSAVEDLVNMLDGRPTGGASMTTHNAHEWLQSRGFRPGMGGPGDMRVGFNPDHMQATLPGGTPFNWGSKEAAARGGVGGTGAYDPSFTSHYYRPATGGVPSLTTSPSLAPSPSLSTSGVPSSAALNSDPSLTNPALTPAVLPPLGSVPSSGGPFSTGMPQAAFFGGPGGPGAGATPIGGLAPPGGSGGGGAVGLTGGGAIGLGMQAGGMALDVMAPGAGQAAQTAIKLGSRAIEFGSQAGSIGVSGVMETLLPTGGSELANNNWATKLLGGLAGMGPALPNTAGGKSAGQLGGQPAQSDQNAPNETNNNYDVKIDAAARDSGGLMRDFEYHTTAAAAAPGM
ncbi:MAG: hypothetical protein PGN27_04270 [Mycolicibacterium neoaurum]|uniref:hypothetical protein n=1 Tax=Mycolicibacterium neoaurum TaxID=1795 RepID=UPI002FF8ADC8